MPVEYVSATFVPNPHKPFVYTHGFSIKNVVSIYLLAAVIPNSRYIIHDGNDRIEVTNPHGTYQIQLPVGNAALTPAKLAEVAQTAVRDGTADDTFQCNILAPSNKIEMRSTLGPFQIKFPSNSTLYRNLGMNGVGGGETSSVPDGDEEGGAHVILCPSAPSRYCNRMYNVRFRASSSQPFCTLDHVIVRRDDAITFYSSQKKNRRVSNSYNPPLPSVQKIVLDILDDSGQRMDLNGLQASLVLSVTYLA